MRDMRVIGLPGAGCCVCASGGNCNKALRCTRRVAWSNGAMQAALLTTAASPPLSHALPG